MPEITSVYATQNGVVIPLETMPDEVFAGKVLGEGVCIIPSDGKVCSPVDGIVESIADTHHAYGIVTADGADFMIHIGIDTVTMKGKGFNSRVRVGQKVKAGELICEIKLWHLEKAGCTSHTALLLTNPDRFKLFDLYTGNALAGKTTVFRYQSIYTP
jgi:glucose-specific phosphotransferase system IIA component